MTDSIDRRALLRNASLLVTGAALAKAVAAQEAAPAPQIKGPSINVTPAPPIIIYPRPDRPMDAPRGALWKI